MSSVRQFISLLFIFAQALTPHALADTTDTSNIQSQIDSINSQKAALDAQIAQYQTELNALGTQHQTLSSSIKSLSVSQSELKAKISSTQKSIAAENLQLTQLGAQIDTAQSAINLDEQAVAASLRDIQSSDDISLPEQVFSASSLTDAWTAVETDQEVAVTLHGHTQDLSSAKDALASTQQQVSGKKQDLSNYNTTLSSQNNQLAVTKQAQQTLLTQTQSKESTYQQLIATKQAQETQFEQTLANLQAQLTPVSAGSVPHPGSGILTWPVSADFMANCISKAGALGNNYCITQFFGNTPFATANPQIYNGMGHDGIDIGMPIGTPVLAALSGTVLATGDTDIKAPDGRECYSFGRWIMLEHPDGLNTLYAHLSSIEVSQGQTVTTGQEIGLSGMTGYATGPHLHFGVYVGSGVQIMDLGKWRGTGGTPCTDAGAVLPVAPDNAYLNPMSYL